MARLTALEFRQRTSTLSSATTDIPFSYEQEGNPRLGRWLLPPVKMYPLTLLRMDVIT